MPYLNLDLDYFDHPKVVRLVGQLGRGADILPIRLWTYTGKYHAETGELTGYSPLEIEAAIKWWGQPGRALDAMLRPFLEKPGFLERAENGYKVHDWEHINGHIHALKVRAQAAANARWDKVRADALAMPKHSSSTSGSNALSFPSFPSNPPLSPPGGYFQDFEIARNEYPGPKRDAQTEWDAFQKKFGAEAAGIVPLLLPAIKRYAAHLAKEAKKSSKKPFLAHFKTWLNQKRWTEEYPGQPGTAAVVDGKARAQAHYRDHGFWPSGTPTDWMEVP